MKIAIISDLHDNEPYLTAFLTTEEDADVLLICGDIGNLETLEKIAKSSFKKIYSVTSNADTFSKEDIPSNITDLGEGGIIELDNKKIGLCHELRKIVDSRHGVSLLKEKPDIIFHGHTHTPWIKSEGQTLIVNPGTLGGWRNPSTYAIWDTSRPAPELVRTEI